MIEKGTDTSAGQNTVKRKSETEPNTSEESTAKRMAAFRERIKTLQNMRKLSS